MNRWRSERVERTFAHVCETGGGRRTRLRRLINVQKAHLLRCCAYNLGLVMRKCFGMSKPRSGAAATICLLILSAVMAYRITGPNLGVAYLPWPIPSALTYLLFAVLARHTSWRLRLVPEIRGF